MAEPALGPAAALVRRYDPVLFQTALFAAEPGRGRLMTLYAFDVELSRALSRSTEPMISRMRLQWWRDVVAGARAGEASRAHEIARPLHELIEELRIAAPLLEGLIEAREMELESVARAADFDCWAQSRFAGLVRLAAECLMPGAAEHPATAEAAEAAGAALAAAFAVRTAAPMAAERGCQLLPDLPEESRANLARGIADERLRRAAANRAEAGLESLRHARRLRRAVPTAARAAFLPLGAAKPVLSRAARGNVDLAPPNSAGVAMGTLWRALSGRW